MRIIIPQQRLLQIQNKTHVLNTPSKIKLLHHCISQNNAREVRLLLIHFPLPQIEQTLRAWIPYIKTTSRALFVLLCRMAETGQSHAYQYTWLFEGLLGATADAILHLIRANRFPGQTGYNDQTLIEIDGRIALLGVEFDNVVREGNGPYVEAMLPLIWDCKLFEVSQAMIKEKRGGNLAELIYESLSRRNLPNAQMFFNQFLFKK